MLRTLFLGAALLGFGAVSSAQAPGPAQTLVDRALDLVASNYYGFRTPDFAALTARADAQLQSACAGQEPCPYPVGQRVLDAVLGEIGDGHTFRLSPNRLAQFNADSRGSPLPMLGLKFDALPDAPALVITRVREESPAARAGLKRGDTLWAVNGKTLDTYGSATEAVDAITALEFAAQPITLSVSSPSASSSSGSTSGAARRELRLTPEPLTPWLPSYALRPDGIAVITFYQFLTAGRIASRVHEYVRAAQSAGARAIILDLRGSGGGSGFESLGSAGAFTEPVGVVFQSRFGASGSTYVGGAITGTGFQIPNPARWTGPMLVLTNHLSRSAAEYLAYFLQRAKRARVYGEPTAGVLNTSTSILGLPDGGAIAVTSGRSSSPDGQPHPERIAPDESIPDDMAALAAGRDTVLERAIQGLKVQSLKRQPLKSP